MIENIQPNYRVFQCVGSGRDSHKLHPSLDEKQTRNNQELAIRGDSVGRASAKVCSILHVVGPEKSQN